MKITDKIRALMEHADSAKKIGSIAEAEAFAEKANQLLLDHKLTMSEIELTAQDDDDPIIDEFYETPGFKREGRVSWMSQLANTLAKAHFCQILCCVGSKTIRVIGRESDRTVMLYLYAVLVREGERLAKKHSAEVRAEAKLNWDDPPCQPKRSFLQGYVRAIYFRLQDIRKQAENKGGQHALTVFNNAALVVKDYVDANVHSDGQLKSHTPRGNRASFEAGQRAGDQASLQGGLSGETHKNANNLLGR